ncbi:branched-chain amino acid ABC transporter permease [Actinotalea ferrariae]|uniref:branched-chain amino acid ABC transporter permease n=1 Tax=Actinotalea ferrariae TaxID=1386098 RepID=UPI001C8B81BB|nr:branched-chain amino acid ABC transporter permease [Actinotalea ferrariae]MBX9245054.1 branched-chain amino acid ABC transporter permease [Actinotalea ferrariae]
MRRAASSRARSWTSRPPRVVGTVGRWLVLLLLTLSATALGQSAAVAATEQCAPTGESACINGTIRTAAGEPAVGVALTIEGEGQELAATTGPDGRWSASVTSAGTYSVTLDEGTLPAGETLRDPANNPREVTVELGASRPALFPLGAPAEQAPDAGDDDGAEGPGGGDQPDDAAGEPGEEPAGVGTSSSGGVTMTRFVQQLVSGLIFGLLLALASVGLSLIYGTTGLSNFAHGEQVTLGGILAYMGVQFWGLPLVVAGTLAVVLAAASGWFQDAAIWQPLRRRNVGLVQAMIVTIGLSMALQYVFQFFFGAGPLRVVTSTPTSVSFGPVLVTRQTVASVIIALVTLAAVSYFLLRTRTGRATRAVSDNAALAAASGISVNRIIRVVWTLGAGLAGLGGVLLGLYLGAARWNSGGALLLLMFAAVTLGGLGAAFGALAGSIVIGLVVELSSLWIPSDMRYGAALVILILVLLFRPQGILGRATRVG